MTKFCPECGTKQHTDDTRFCSNCGFDFSKLEEDEKITVSISSDESDSNSNTSSNSNSSVGNGGTVSNKTSNSTYKPSNSTNKFSNSTYKPSNSTYKKVSFGSNGFLSNWSIPKCFAVLAVLLIFLTVLGMLVQTTETEPTSDEGLTSFMENSHSQVPDFLQDSYFDSDDEYNDSNDYLSFLDR